MWTYWMLQNYECNQIPFNVSLQIKPQFMKRGALTGANCSRHVMSRRLDL